MKYFLMVDPSAVRGNESGLPDYLWVEVLKDVYDDPPVNIVNKASINSDGFVTISIANIGLDSLKELFAVLQEAYNSEGLLDDPKEDTIAV